MNPLQDRAAWDVAEAARYLGIAKISVYKLVSARAIPRYKVLRRVVFDPAELAEWRQARAVRPLRERDER